MKELDDELKERLPGIFLTSPMGAFVPNLRRVRAALEGLQASGIDAKAAYERHRRYRPEHWSKLPEFEDLMR